MKRSLALLLTSLLLVFSLAACGKDQQPGGVGGDDASSGSVTGGDNANGSVTGNSGVNDGGTANDSITGGVNNGGSGSMMDDAMDTMDDMGDAVQGAGNAMTGGTAGYTNSRMKGYTYDQMLRNGRVF